MALTTDQQCEVRKISELEIRRYMDDLFERTLPRVVESAIAAHNDSVIAHGVLFKQQWSKLRLGIVAFASGAGIAGVSWVTKLLGGL